MLGARLEDSAMSEVISAKDVDYCRVVAAGFAPTSPARWGTHLNC